MSSKDLSRRQIYPMIIWLFAILCGIAALICFIIILHNWSFMASSITTQGTIIDEGTDVSKSSTNSYMVVQFTDN